MKVVIISDIHDNIESLKICLNWSNKKNADMIICCGDVGKYKTLNILASLFKKDIILVKGNAEIYDEEELLSFDNIKYLGKYGSFELDNKNVGVCHEPYYITKVVESCTCDILFYGHLHQPWDNIKSGVRSVNPGTLGDRFMPGTFAYWDTKNDEISLKILNEL